MADPAEQFTLRVEPRSARPTCASVLLEALRRQPGIKVIAIDPGYQGASAYDVLAQIELATRIKDGTAEKAVEYLQKALEIETENSNLYVHLAEAYLALDKEAEAKRQLERVLKMKPSAEYLPEHSVAVEQAKKLLAKKFR